MSFSPLPSIAEPEPAPKNSEPIAVVPLTALCPLTLHSNAPQFSSVHEEFLAEQEGLRRMAEKVQEAEQKKRAARGTKGTKPKIVDREGNRGTWYPCKIEEGPNSKGVHCLEPCLGVERPLTSAIKVFPGCAGTLQALAPQHLSEQLRRPLQLPGR